MTWPSEELNEYLLLRNICNQDGYWVWAEGDLSEDGTLFSYTANHSMGNVIKYINEKLEKTHPGLKIWIADHTFTDVYCHTVGK